MDHLSGLPFGVCRVSATTIKLNDPDKKSGSCSLFFLGSLNSTPGLSELTPLITPRHKVVSDKCVR